MKLGFKDKSIAIEGIQFDGNFEEVEEFCGGDAEFRDGELVVATSRGAMYVRPKNYIIKMADGNLYSCEPDMFHAIYNLNEDGYYFESPRGGILK